MAEIILTTHWTGGDVLPFIKLGTYLSCAGHRVTLVTHCIYETMALEKGMDFVAWDTTEEYEALISDMGKYTDEVSKKEEILEFRDKYENAAVKYKEYEILKRLCKGKKNVIIIAKNRSESASLLLSEQDHIPLILVFMNPFETSSIQIFNEVFRVRACQEANDLRKLAGAPRINDWLEWQSSPKMQVALWPEWFHSEENGWPVTLRKVGFPTGRLYRNEKSEEYHRIKEYIKDNQDLIIISGGTSRQINNGFYRSAVNACVRLKIPTIVITKYREMLPEELPDPMIWFDAMDLKSVIPYATLVINHGGIGTVSEAIYAGVPQLVLGHNVDRPLNGSIVSRLGLGKYLPLCDWKPEIIADDILELLQGKYKKQCTDFVRTYLAKETSALQKIRDIVREVEGEKTYAVEFASDFHPAMEAIPDYVKDILRKKLEEMRKTSMK